jgi:hypothetical protein
MLGTQGSTDSTTPRVTPTPKASEKTMVLSEQRRHQLSRRGLIIEPVPCTAYFPCSLAGNEPIP